MELSTSMPTPSARPDSEITFRLISEKYISATAAVRLMGMDRAITKVGRTSFKNRIRIRMARPAPISRFWNTDPTT